MAAPRASRATHANANPKPHVSNNNRSASTPHIANNNNNNRATIRPSTAVSANSAINPTRPTYAYGTGTRRYNPRGYGRGYQNRYVGYYRGYGRSQGNDRSIVSRLRSVHGTLARIDHDYQGHRARAMHQVSRAISQLSHRSLAYRTAGYSGQSNNNFRLASNTNGNGNRNGQANGVRGQRMTQAQSDSRMNQAMRTTQGITMQLSHQGSNHPNHARAYRHLQQALREMNTALSVR
jgi:hypothetical protein